MKGRHLPASPTNAASPARIDSTLRIHVRPIMFGLVLTLFVVFSSPVAEGATIVVPQESDTITDTSFDDIKFEMEVGGDFDRSMLTDSINDLVGKKIRIRGYIRPSFQQDGIRQFILVRDNQECCFGPGAALYDCVLVKMEKGKTTSFTVRPVAVEGTFTVKEFEGPDGKLWAIYRMVANRVE